MPPQSDNTATSLGPNANGAASAHEDVDANGRPKKPRNLPCDICPKMFRRVEHLERHIRTHTKEKPFLCAVEGCDRRFSRRDLLSRHERLSHPDVPPELLSKTRRPKAKNSIHERNRRSISSASSGASTQQTTEHPHMPQPGHTTQHLPSHFPNTSALHNDNQIRGNNLDATSMGLPHDIMTTQSMNHAINTLNSQINTAFPGSFSQAGGYTSQPVFNNQSPLMHHQQYTLTGQHDIPVTLSQMTMREAINQQPSTLNGNSPLDVLSSMAAGHQALNPAQIPMARSNGFTGPGSSQVHLPSMGSLAADLGAAYEPRSRTMDSMLGVDIDYDQFNLLDGFDFSNNNIMGVGMGQLDDTDPINWAKGFYSNMNSRFPSRAGSPNPDDGNRTSQPLVPLSSIEEQTRVPLLRHISPADYETIKASINNFANVLPPDFAFPSRHTLMRYLQGYCDGMNDNLPILHLPTLFPTTMAPELLLAVAAIGAAYRFEKNRSYLIWYAARAIAIEQMNRRRSPEVKALLPTRSQYSNHSTLPSPRPSYRQLNMSAGGDRRNILDLGREPFVPNTPAARMETIQALLLLYAAGLWSAKAVFDESKTIQSTLSLLLNEDGLGPDPPLPDDCGWNEWIERERAIRTKIFAYCYFNLSNIAYGSSPTIIFSELYLSLPQSGKLWRADTSTKWKLAKASEPKVTMTLQNAFAYIMKGKLDSPPLKVTTLGLYILAHALMQQIWLLKQSSLRGEGVSVLKTSDINDLANAMRVWEYAYNDRQAVRAQENRVTINALHSAPSRPNINQSDDPNHPATQIAHNATSLVRLASIKLYTDSNSGRELDNRNDDLLAQKLSNFQNGPEFVPLPRIGNTNRAVFHALWSLSVLAKTGVDYATFYGPYDWSIQHLLCHFESATLIARWLVTLSVTNQQKTVEQAELQLLHMIRVVMYEAGVSDSIDPMLEGNEQPMNLAEAISPNDGIAMRRLARTVLRLWSRLFSGKQVWDIVGNMGRALEKYAAIAETVPAGYGNANIAG